ncbi:MAG: adenylate/guanylate cyclase domain-containing protein [Syntrophobacteraceae bacterium]
MISVEEDLIDSITAVFHRLSVGRAPCSVPIPDELPNNEIRQLITYINRFLTEFSAFAEAMEQISKGELESRSPFGRMAVVHSFKTLQSNLRHLSFKTQQIAGGDLEQKVDFLGDFSIAFNSMTQQLKDTHEQLTDANQELEKRNRFIRKTFGRYTSDDIVDVLLDMPEGLKLGGEKRDVTLLMSDLRGFTALAERLDATEVVALLNHYLSVMVDLIHQDGGTIDDIIGDAILVVFGAPMTMPDAANRAVHCALQMQRSMREVNEHNVRKGWPEIEMGIGLHTGDVVVGNIGSTKRSKYGVVGQAVNLTARVESFTVGGQVLVSPTLIRAADRGLVLGEEIRVHGKGMLKAIKCRELLGHEAFPELLIDQGSVNLRPLPRPAPCLLSVLTGKHLGVRMVPAALVSVSGKGAVVEVTGPLKRRADIMIRLQAGAGEDAPEYYAKVIQPVDQPGGGYLIHFTSPPGTPAKLRRLAGEI